MTGIPLLAKRSSGDVGGRAGVAERLITSGAAVISTDMFDTLVLRDGSTETDRLACAARRAAAELGVSPALLVRARWDVQRAAYRAVAVERPTGDASLRAMCAAVAATAGLGSTAHHVLARCEVDVDIARLRANRCLVALLAHAATRGARIIVVSDTYYSADDLERILTEVIGSHPVSGIYSSADLGATKHSGSIFARVAAAEGVDPAEILHLGDHPVADGRMAAAAGWRVVAVPRGRAHRVRVHAGRLRAAAQLRRRSR